jgi:hypothetical protein
MKIQIRRVADPDPGYGAFLTTATGIRNGLKIQDPASRSGMNILDHISESWETIFWVIIPKFFLKRMRIREPGIFLTLDPGWKKFGSGKNIPDPQHCPKK